MTGISSGPPARFSWHAHLPTLRVAFHFGLHLTGFMVSTLLMSWGVFALAFLLLGGISLDGLMHQLNNLSRRYVEAGPERAQSFWNVFLAAHLVVTIVLVVLRRDRIVPTPSPERICHHG